MRYLILFFFLISPSVFSADYTWLGNNKSGPSPSSVCSQLLATVVRPTGEPYVLTFVSPTLYKCSYNWWGDSAHTYKPSTTVDITRSGDSCPTNYEYDSSTGLCSQNLCSETAGSTEYHVAPSGNTRPDTTVSFGDGQRVAPPHMCADSCRYEAYGGGSVSCGPLNGGDPLVEFCIFRYSGMGTSCQSDPAQFNGNTDPVAPTDPNDPTDPANNCGPTHVWSGSTCVPKLDTDDDGDGGGDDGSGDGGGDDGGDSGSGGGGDGGSGDGGDDGTGTGGGGDGTGDDPSSVAGEGCKAILECEGDAIQCALLRKQKEDYCDWHLDSDVADTILDQYQGEEYELGEKTIDIGAGFTSALSAPRFLPSSCPAPVTFSVRGKSYSLKWDYVCDFASGLSPIIVAMAAIFFGLYVGRGLGGE